MAAIAMQVVVAGLLCAVVRGEVGGFGYGLFALSIPLALTTVPLLGELSPLLQADRASEWVGAQPVTPKDLRSARVLTLLAIVGMLSLASLIPAALLAPGTMGLAERGALVVGGLLQTWVLAALLLALQGILAKAGQGAAVLLQTVVFLGVLVGVLTGLKSVSLLSSLTGAEPVLRFTPQAWFAAPLATEGQGFLFAAAALAAAAGALILSVAPFPKAPGAQSTGSILSLLLTPLRRTAEALWVRDDERGPFAFVYDALPAERDFVIRTYPLVAAPLVFMVLGADPSKLEGEGLFALLLFAPAAYLPFVLLHVPTTSTPEARWVIDTSPIEPSSEDRGAMKAVAVRLLAPLYIGIGAMVYAFASPSLCLRLWPVAVTVGLLTLRLLYRGGAARPLSTRANDLASAWNDGLGGMLIVIAVGMTLIAVAAWRMVPNPWVGWVLLAALLAVEVALFGRRPGVKTVSAAR